MKVSLLAIIGLLPLAIGVSFVYADHDIPFDSWIDHACMTNEVGIFICTWTPGDKSVTGGTTITPPLTETDETVEEETTDEPVIPEKQLTRAEKDIQRMIDKITLDLIERPDQVPDADKQLLELLLRAQEKCEFGIEEGAPIQTYEIFAIPEGYFYPEDTDFAKYNMLGKITKLVEACVNWTDYKVKWLGPQYLAIQQANMEAIELDEERVRNQTLFAETWMTFQNITISDEFMNRAISEHDKIEEVENAFDDFCTSQNFGNATKLLYGCDVTIPDNQGGFTDTSENSAWLKYQRYLNDPENATAEPRYNVSTNPKCAILSSFITQYEIDKEAGNVMLQEAGCKL